MPKRSNTSLLKTGLRMAGRAIFGLGREGMRAVVDETVGKTANQNRARERAFDLVLLYESHPDKCREILKAMGRSEDEFKETTYAHFRKV